MPKIFPDMDKIITFVPQWFPRRPYERGSRYGIKWEPGVNPGQFPLL